MIITMERLAHFPGAAASRPRAASFLPPPPSYNACSIGRTPRPSPAPRSPVDGWRRLVLPRR